MILIIGRCLHLCARLNACAPRSPRRELSTPRAAACCAPTHTPRRALSCTSNYTACRPRTRLTRGVPGPAGDLRSRYAPTAPVPFCRTCVLAYRCSPRLLGCGSTQPHGQALTHLLKHLFARPGSPPPRPTSQGTKGWWMVMGMRSWRTAHRCSPSRPRRRSLRQASGRRSNSVLRWSGRAGGTDGTSPTDGLTAERHAGGHLMTDRHGRHVR